MAHWFENDRLWQAMEPFIFGDEVLKAAKAEVDGIINLLKIKPGARILDMCCGPGRHTIELARRGFEVTGVDRTTLYLDQARTKAGEENLKIEFIQVGMDKFSRPDGFDAILSMYTSFGYFENQNDDRRVLKNIHNSLTKSGRLIIDLIGKERLTRIYQKRDWREIDGSLLLEERIPSEDWRYLNNRWIIIENGQREEFTFALRVYSAVELKELLHDVGFKKTELFSSLEGDKYSHQSGRLIVVAYK